MQDRIDSLTAERDALLADDRTPFQKWITGDGPHAKPRSVYVASSWRSLLQQVVVHAIRAFGIDVYDFRNPAPGNTGFSWSSINPDWQRWTPAQWRDALKSGIAKRGYDNDKAGMDGADCCVLVLPCRRSAHLEAGFMAAQGKPVFTVALEKTEPELMSLLLGPADHICTSMDELFDRLGCPK